MWLDPRQCGGGDVGVRGGQGRCGLPIYSQGAAGCGSTWGTGEMGLPIYSQGAAGCGSTWGTGEMWAAYILPRGRGMWEYVGDRGDVGCLYTPKGPREAGP
eukprot:1194777-Prorocentrum_minimum.AAC.5